MSTEDSLASPQRSFGEASGAGHSPVLQRLAIAGAVVLACGAAFSAERVWSNLLVGTFYLLTIALGGALFMALTYVTGGGWHVAFRRIPEAMAKVLPVAGVATLVVLGVRMSHYGWQHDWHGDAGTFWFKGALAYSIVLGSPRRRVHSRVESSRWMAGRSLSQAGPNRRRDAHRRQRPHLRTVPCRIRSHVFAGECRLDDGVGTDVVQHDVGSL